MSVTSAYLKELGVQGRHSSMAKAKSEPGSHEKKALA